MFKVRAGNMFTKAQPNSLWQGTEEKITACAAAKFRRFKKVLLYLQWMWLMLGRPWESGWLIHCYFQRKGDQGFFFFPLCGIHFLVKLRKMHTLSRSWQFQFAQGRVCVTADNKQMHTGLFQGTQYWISSNPALCVCNWRLQRSGCEWIKAWINSKCI